MGFPAKSPVVGIPISTTSYKEVVEAISQRPRDRGVSVAVCNVHSVMSARRDAPLRAAIEKAEIATPDGVPLVWGLRWTGHPEQQRVYGPELMRRALADSAQLTPDDLARAAAAAEAGLLSIRDLLRDPSRFWDEANQRIRDAMTRDCTTIQRGLLAAEALQIMDAGKFNALLVVDADQRLIGALNMHDLLRAGVV